MYNAQENMSQFYYFGHVKGRQPILGDDFYFKALPTMFIGAIIWFATTLYYAGYLWAPAFSILSLTSQATIIYFVVYIILWISMIIFAFLRINTIAAVLFWGAAGFSGFMMSFFLHWTAGEIGIDLAKNLFNTSALLAVGASGGAMLLGFKFKDRIGEHFCIIFMLFGIFYTIFELMIIMLFGYSNWIVDILMFGYIFGVMVFDAATIPGKIQSGYWMMAVIDIFFDFIAMLFRIFIILIRIYGKARR
jgi:hypothetical protein